MIEKYFNLQGMRNLGQEIERFTDHVSNHSKGKVPREDAIPNLGKILNPDLQRIGSVIACDSESLKIVRDKAAGYSNDGSKESVGT